MSKRPAYQDWKKVKFKKQENRVRGEHDFSIRLEATKKDSVQTGNIDAVITVPTSNLHKN